MRHEKLEPYQDQINEIKRDALCDYIIAREQELKFKDKSNIYAFLFLDVEMDGCFRTSRVVCANSSLQLYVHRVLMNLEQLPHSNGLSVLIGEALNESQLAQFVQEWEWRKNYRVWEANRKVFLYAENYMEPDFRDNKTHIFKELEDELLQQKITKESAEFAYRKYVAGLTELAKLRIVGSYYRTEHCSDGDIDIYYLFGRTHTNPYQYYYRTLIRKPDPSDPSGTKEDSVWGNWVKMELAIEAGEISVLVYLGRLYVFWTQVERREITMVNAGTATPGGYVFKVYAKYSYLDEHGRWSAPQKVYVGYRWIDGPIIFEWASRHEPPMLIDTDAQKTAVVEHFQEEVFRKPYPIEQSINLATPIRLYYIWSDEKTEQPSEGAGEPSDQYETVACTENDVRYKRHGMCETEQEAGAKEAKPPCQIIWDTAEVSVPSRRFEVVGGVFPASIPDTPYSLVGFGLNESRSGTLRLQSATRKYIMDIDFPFSFDEWCDACRNQTPTTETITVDVRRVRSSGGSASSVPYGPKVSSHNLSLATTSIKDAGEITPSEITAEEEFLLEEYREASRTDVQAGYVQDGTKDFTDICRIVSQYPENCADLMIPDQQQPILLSTILVDELSWRIYSEEITEFLSLETQCLPADSPGNSILMAPTALTIRSCSFTSHSSSPTT